MEGYYTYRTTLNTVEGMRCIYVEVGDESYYCRVKENYSYEFGCSSYFDYEDSHPQMFTACIRDRSSAGDGEFFGFSGYHFYYDRWRVKIIFNQSTNSHYDTANVDLTVPGNFHAIEENIGDKFLKGYFWFDP